MKPLDVQREVELTLTCLDRIRKAKAPVNFAEILARRMIFADPEVKWIKSARIALTVLVALAVIVS